MRTDFASAFRWCRSLALAQPPANGHEPSGFWHPLFAIFAIFCGKSLWFLALPLSAGVAHGQVIGRPPSILTPPQSQLVAAGSNVTFTVSVAPSATPLAYQWLQDGGGVTGATNQTLVLTKVASGSGGGYSVTVANAAGTITSDPATLTVAGIAFNGPRSVSLGATLTPRVFANPFSGLSFQWQQNGVAISGATNTSLSLTNVRLADTTAYSLLVSNAAGLLILPANLDIDPTFTKITTGPIVTEPISYGVGATWGDYDNDGFIDLFVAQANIGNRLYRNNGDGSFTKITTGTIATDRGESIGATWGDYDNDGFLDLFVSNLSGANYLYHNNHDGTFTRALTSPIATDRGDSRGAAWGDYDNDGLLDLYVAHPSGGTNTLYHNNGDGTFSHAAAGSVTRDVGFSLGASWGDFNNDGLLDLFVANFGGLTGGYGVATKNFLYQNNGQGAFTKISAGSIVTDLAVYGGCAWGDYDNDGFLDLFVSNFGHGGEPHNLLYHNNGDGTFTRVANAGPIVTDPAQAVDCAWADYDNDGYLDLFVANGQGSKSFLYRNKGNGTFEKIATGSLANDLDSSGGGAWSCTWGDYDNDGFLDLFVGNGNYNGGSVNYLYRNNGNSNGWLKLKLVGTVSNRVAIGAKVRVKATIGGKTFWQLRETSGGGGYRCQNGLLPHFGLGDATNIDIVRIEWPSGIVQEMTNVAVKTNLTVIEQGVGILPMVSNLAPGSNVTYTARSTLTGPLSFQWRFNGQDLPGATNATLAVPNVQAANLGQYTVVVAPADGSAPVSSAPALLNLAGPPLILTPPQSQLVEAGSNVTFTVSVAPSATPLSYQWLFNGNPVAATTTNLVLTNIAFASGGSYSVTVANAAGTITSDPATLTVAVIGFNGPQSVSLGATLTPRVLANPFSGLSFQWQQNGVAISGATNTSLSLTNVQLADATAYSLLVSNAAGSLLLPANLSIDPTFTKITTGPIVGNAPGKAYSATWGDYNNDGFIDLFVGKFGYVNRLYQNNGDGSFTKITTGRIVNDKGQATGTVWGDYDNDGYLDLFVSNFGGVNFLYHNSRDGSFTRSLAGPIATDQGNSTGSVWGDYDNDGFLDLFAPRYQQPNLLYHNNGDGTFSSVEAGDLPSGIGGSFGASWGDFNNDGLLDLFVANSGGPNFLYQNNGNGSFTKIIKGNIVTDVADSAGCAWADYDNDGFLDLFVANTSGPKNFLYHNNGDGTFTSVTNAGPIVTDPAYATDCAWADYDNDGYLDLFVANASGPKNFLYHNKGDGTFEKITTGSLANDQSPPGYGSLTCSWGDYDNDGFLDLFADTGGNGSNGNDYLYRNNGNSNGWLKFKLVGMLSNKSAIGTKVRVLATIRGKTFWQLREASGGGGSGSQSGLLPHFGLGDATNVDTVRIEWPSGIVQEMRNVAVKTNLTVIEQGVAVFPPVQSLLVGSAATLTAKPTFTNSLSYQWRFNGQDLQGATNASLTVPSASAASAGQYTVLVTPADGSAPVSSAPAWLRLPGAPIITAQPESQTVAAGANVTLSVGAAGDGPFSYQWLFNGNNLAGQTNRTLMLANLTPAQAGSYTVVISNVVASLTSRPAVLSVSLPIVTQPVRLMVLPQANGRFQVRVASGSNQTFVLQGSTNLLDWLALLTNSVSSGVFDFADPDSGNFKQRFYRARGP